jgi:hypothetical protein
MEPLDIFDDLNIEFVLIISIVINQLGTFWAIKDNNCAHPSFLIFGSQSW